jgi:uncharacterized membrane protein YphA (DoxX/SURF4 family)
MRTKVIAYWTTTAILAFVWLTGGAADLAHRPETVEGMVRLGYPLYFVTILGFWKLLGAIAVLAPRFPRLKEWAYAGTFFELTGAVVSQAASGDSVVHIIVPGFFAACAVASWALRPESRRLGVLFPPRLTPRRVPGLSPVMNPSPIMTPSRATGC